MSKGVNSPPAERWTTAVICTAIVTVPLAALLTLPFFFIFGLSNEEPLSPSALFSFPMAATVIASVLLSVAYVLVRDGYSALRSRRAALACGMAAVCLSGAVVLEGAAFLLWVFVIP